MELVSRVRISVVNSDALLNSDEEPSSTKIAPINEWRPPISIRVLKIRYLCQRKLRIRGYEVNRIKFADNSWDIIEETKPEQRSDFEIKEAVVVSQEVNPEKDAVKKFNREIKPLKRNNDEDWTAVLILLARSGLHLNKTE